MNTYSKKSFILISCILFLVVALWKFELLPRGYLINESSTTHLNLNIYEVDESSFFSYSLGFHGGRESEYKTWLGREFTEFELFHGYYQPEDYELKSSNIDILQVTKHELIPIKEGSVTIHVATNEGVKDSFQVQLSKINDYLVPKVVSDNKEFPQKKLRQDQIFEYYQVDRLPEYEGSTDFQPALNRNLEWPELFHGEGRVVISFVVTSDGKLQHIQVLRELCQPCDDNAIKALTKLDEWSPGERNGQAVSTRMYANVLFRLQ